MKPVLEARDRQRLEALAGILGRCFVLTVVAMLVVWGVMYMAGDPVHRLHAVFFDLSSQQFDLLSLAALTFIKSLNVVFFMFPYLAIKHYLYVTRRG